MGQIRVYVIRPGRRLLLTIAAGTQVLRRADRTDSLILTSLPPGVYLQLYG